jgi:hypothetical protein
MEDLVEVALESRKEWAKPELKKIDIEQITANTYLGSGADHKKYSHVSS